MHFCIEGKIQICLFKILFNLSVFTPNVVLFIPNIITNYKSRFPSKIKKLRYLYQKPTLAKWQTVKNPDPNFGKASGSWAANQLLFSKMMKTFSFYLLLMSFLEILFFLFMVLKINENIKILLLIFINNQIGSKFLF